MFSKNYLAMMEGNTVILITDTHQNTLIIKMPCLVKNNLTMMEQTNA